ncbi:YceI family protein [Pseudodesulfovibrio sp. zrk46]|uniref:YceI family protein n=1 Tax=Pseudodesulfovibrio sp. zrk46 TaxID=2725288 RepID=UPI00144A0158|nr:YceI family protein [Pseudodesulfovibrio sp. zrk46]QJB56910.1 hypothetical protein HFN16_11065 [Pseudodesulfovibrio sp. zrk46]
MNTQLGDRLNAKDVVAFLERGEGALVDTLTPEHFEARHIPGALNACVYEMTFLETVAKLVPDKDTSIMLYGAGTNSRDSITAADKLARAGYSDVSVFTGGLEEWREKGHPLGGLAADQADPPHPQLELESRTYSLVNDESIIKWTGRNNNGGHHGTLSLSEGELDAEGDPVGSFVIDMTSIRNIDLEGDELHPVLEAHLNSDDFFFTTMFPEARFETTQIRIVEDGHSTRPNAMIQGYLSVRGVSNEIAFPAHIRNLEDARISISANLDIDRTQWDVIYGSSRFFRHLGYHVVYDFISLDFRLVLE